MRNKTQVKPETEISNNASFQEIRKIYIILTIFGIAMGFLEGIVVVYIRQVYYPHGFDFPLTLLSPEMLTVEWIREIATIVMLAAIGWLAGKNILQRLSYFLFTFAIWDIFYYAALILLLDWPPSLFTWDILFLIPVAWIGPVLAPVICSVSMIFMALILTLLPVKGIPVKTGILNWILIFTGAGIILYTYMIDYLKLIFQSGYFSRAESMEAKDHFWKIITSYIPSHYNWFLFSVGEVLILCALGWILTRSVTMQKRLGETVFVEAQPEGLKCE
jgi:hypothetical protein